MDMGGRTLMTYYGGYLEKNELWWFKDANW